MSKLLVPSYPIIAQPPIALRSIKSARPGESLLGTQCSKSTKQCMYIDVIAWRHKSFAEGMIMLINKIIRTIVGADLSRTSPIYRPWVDVLMSAFNS